MVTGKCCHTLKLSGKVAPDNHSSVNQAINRRLISHLIVSSVTSSSFSGICDVSQAWQLSIVFY
jgi:hypothetical protein